MKFLKKASLVLFVLLVLSQIPFAYHRYELRRLSAAIRQTNSQRVLADAQSSHRDYAGVVHVHSFLGGHSSGGFEEIIQAAKENGLSFVIMTEHPAKEFNTAEKTLNGMHGGVLFVNGNEMRAVDGDRLLVIPGDEVTGSSRDMSTDDVLKHTTSRGEIAVVAYPEDYKSWSVDGFNGVEVYNVYTNARRINPIVAFFDSLWSYRTYRELLFTTFFDRPSSALSKWDEVNQRRRVVALAGNDSHANIGVSLNDSSGKRLLALNLDPYEVSFRLVRVHLLLEKDEVLDDRALMQALAQGHCFIGFDLFGDSSGFSFSAGNGKDQRILGDEITLLNGVKVTVSSSLSARVVLFKDGKKLDERVGVTSCDFQVGERGVYRVELYLPQLGKRAGEQPWIISNPIYVR